MNIAVHANRQKPLRGGDYPLAVHSVRQSKQTVAETNDKFAALQRKQRREFG